MESKNQIFGANVRLLGAAADPHSRPEHLWDSDFETVYGWEGHTGSESLVITFTKEMVVDVVVCRWLVMPSEYTIDLFVEQDWVEVSSIQGNLVLGPKVQLHLIPSTTAKALRIRVKSLVEQDLHGRECPAGYDVALSGIQVNSTQDLPIHLVELLEKETPRLVATPSVLEGMARNSHYEPDMALLDTPIPEFEPIPKRLYGRQQTGREVNEKNAERRKLLNQCAWAYARTGREDFAEKTRSILLSVMAHYDRYQCFRFTGIDWKAVTYQDPAYNLGDITEVYDLLATSKHLTIQDRLKFVYFCVDLGEFQYLALRDRFEPRENWAACSLAEMVFLAFYFEGFPEASRWEAMADQRYAKCFEPFLDDGYWWECSPAHSVYMIRGMAKYAIGKYLLGRPVWSKECDGKSLESIFEALGKTMTPFGEHPSINDSNGNDGHLLSEWPELRAPLFLMERGDLLKMMKDKGDPPFVPGIEIGQVEHQTPSYNSVLLPDAGMAVMRDGWEKDDAYLIFDYGPHGGSHGHPDKLSFILFANGNHWIPDAGNSPHYSIFTEQQTWHKQTVAHNTVLANNESQQECTGELCFWHTDANIDMVSAEHTGYEGLLHRRTIVHPRTDYFLIHDVLTTNDDAFDLEWLLHVYGEQNEHGPGWMSFHNSNGGLLVVSDSISEECPPLYQGLCGGFKNDEWQGAGYPPKGGPGWIYVPYVRLPARVDKARPRAEFQAVIFPFQDEKPNVELHTTQDTRGLATGIRILCDDTEDLLVISHPECATDAQTEYDCWDISGKGKATFERRAGGETRFRSVVV